MLSDLHCVPQVSRNVTTNELANWQRYRYMRGADGSFSNPFDRGCKRNCSETMWPPRQRSPVVLSEDAGDAMSLLKMEQGQIVNGCELKGQ